MVLIIVLSGYSTGQAREIHPLDNMPLVQNGNLRFSGSELPQAERGPDVIRYISTGVKVSHKIGKDTISGSGSLIYYDKDKNIAYVASCGHLWQGNMTAEQSKKKPVPATVTVWYHNYQKLNTPRIYQAKVLFYSNEEGKDSSLLCFNPDWQPDYFPLAPINFPIIVGSIQHSIGCDNGSEIANYNVQIVGMKGNDLITVSNSPRPGRSGGGLLNNEGYYIGTCWGTTSFVGDGYGYFTPLSGIHAVYSSNGYNFLFNLKPLNLIRNIPIIDRNRPQGNYGENYIPFPTN